MRSDREPKPGSISLTQGNAGSIAGVSLSEANNVPGEIFIVSLSDSAGVLSASTAGSASVNQFNGPQEVTISGTLNQVNAALATLTDTDASTGSDTITANARDSFGNVAATQTIGVTISPLVPVLAAPGSRLVAGISCAAS